jgi:hypothetical protein
LPDFYPNGVLSTPAEFERLQSEFDAMCAWFREAATRTPTELAKRTPLTLEQLGGGSPPSGADQFYVESAAEELKLYNSALGAVGRLKEPAVRSEGEATLAIVGPFLLAVALALRITKVTGEIRLDRGK